MVALDNADAYAQLLDGQAFGPSPAPPLRGAPPPRARVEVEWGSEWFAGVITSSKPGLNSNGAPATIYRVWYDATTQHRAQGAWHDLAEIHWRLIPAPP
ncbi:hypothetical protein AB1Y20_013618 [Prymnesium parvum]